MSSAHPVEIERPFDFADSIVDGAPRRGAQGYPPNEKRAATGAPRLRCQRVLLVGDRDQPIRIGTKILSSPRCTSSAADLLDFETIARICSTLDTGVLFTDRITSPGSTPAAAAGPLTSSTTSPPFAMPTCLRS